MKFAYLPSTTFQKQIYLSDITSSEGRFDIIWHWQPNTSFSSYDLAPYLYQLIDKYEILRASIIDKDDSIVQKIAESSCKKQVILQQNTSAVIDAEDLQGLVDSREGVSFIIFHDSAQIVQSIYGIASHAIIDATSIDLLRSEVCKALMSGNLQPHSYDFQFADLTNELDSLELQWPDSCSGFHKIELDVPIQSITLDSRRGKSCTWTSPVFNLRELLSPLPSDVNLTLLGRLFQHLIFKSGVFLNKPTLDVGLALDARNFLNLSSLVGPAVVIKKGSFNIRELYSSEAFSSLSDFFYESKISTKSSNLIKCTDNCEILFNLLVEPSELDNRLPLTSVPFDNRRGASAPLTIDCRVDISSDQAQIFLRSNSNSLDNARLVNLGSYLISQSEDYNSVFISPFEEQDLASTINTALALGGSRQCLHWISGSENHYFSYDQLRQQVVLICQCLIESKISSCRILTKCIQPFDYISSILAIVLTNNVFVPLDQRRNNDSKRIELIESICDYELKLDSQSFLPVLIPLPATHNFDICENAEDDVCLMFTSGSTGTPKGVRITSRGILRLLELAKDRSWTQSNFLMHSDIGFDASLFEIWVPILSGGKITCVDHLLIMREGVVVDVDCSWLSVSMLTQVLRCTNNILRSKVICTGGEHVPYSLVSAIQSSGFFDHGNQLFNGYGPTESTTFVFLDEIKPSDYEQKEGVMSRLLPASKVSLISFLGKETPIGGIGELIVSGDGVANGYLDAQSHSSFFYNQSSQLSYRTGDYFEKVSECSYRFIGRADDLLKVSGYRVSVEQIRLKLSKFIKSSDVFALKVNDNGIASCICFVRSSQLVNQDFINNTLQSMRSSVPHYLIPNHVILIDDIPLTPNGKVDKSILLRLYKESDLNTESLITIDELLSKVPQFTEDFIHNISHLTHDSLALVDLHSRLADLGFNGDLFALSNCRDTSDLSIYFIDDVYGPRSHQDSPLSTLTCGDYIFSSFNVDVKSFDQVSLLCFLDTFFEIFDFNPLKPFYIIENVSLPQDYINTLRENAFLKVFPICCTYTIQESVRINLFSTSAHLSLFLLEELSRTCHDFLKFKGTSLSRLSKLKQFSNSFHQSYLLRDSSINYEFIIDSISNASQIFDLLSFQRILVLLPDSSYHCTGAVLFEFKDGSLIPCNSSPGSSDVIFYINGVNNSTGIFAAQLKCSIIEGSVGNSQLAWTFEDISLVYYAPVIHQPHNFTFKTYPSSWRSVSPDEQNPCVVLVSPVADDLLPILPLAKAFAAKGYSVTALTYGLLKRASLDTINHQTDRILDFLDKDKPCIIVGYSYSGLIVNNLSSILSKNDFRYVIIDTPNPLLLQNELEQIPSNSKLYWLSQVCRRLLKSKDFDEVHFLNIKSILSNSDKDFASIVNEVRYQLISLGVISFSIAVDDLLDWVNAAQVQFDLFKNYKLKSSSGQTTFVCADISQHSIAANQSWDSYCRDMKVVNVNADHFTILKSTNIEQYIDNLALSLL